MESITAYLISFLTVLVFLLVAAVIANAIKFEGGSHPKDPRSRKTWFWILAILNPVVCFLLGYFLFKPEGNIMVVNDYVFALTLGTVIGFFLYLILGFTLSKLFANGKIGHWF